MEKRWKSEYRWSLIIGAVLLVIAVELIAYDIRTGERRINAVRSLPKVTDQFVARNILKAERVDSTVYLSREALAKLSRQATRTFLVTKIDGSIWAYAELPDSTTPYGAKISLAPRKAEYDRYCYYHLSTWWHDGDTVTMIWKASPLQKTPIMWIAYGILMAVISIGVFWNAMYIRSDIKRESPQPHQTAGLV